MNVFSGQFDNRKFSSSKKIGRNPSIVIKNPNIVLPNFRLPKVQNSEDRSRSLQKKFCSVFSTWLKNPVTIVRNYSQTPTFTRLSPCFTTKKYGLTLHSRPK